MQKLLFIFIDNFGARIVMLHLFLRILLVGLISLQSIDYFFVLLMTYVVFIVIGQGYVIV